MQNDVKICVFTFLMSKYFEISNINRVPKLQVWYFCMDTRPSQGISVASATHLKWSPRTTTSNTSISTLRLKQKKKGERLWWNRFYFIFDIFQVAGSSGIFHRPMDATLLTQRSLRGGNKQKWFLKVFETRIFNGNPWPIMEAKI